MARRKLNEGEVRERLLEAAVTLFATRGYAATSTREIVAAAGVTKPVLYYYFRSKEGIFRAIFEDAGRVVSDALQAGVETQGTIRERVERLFLVLLGQFERRRTLVRFMNSVIWGPPQETPPCDVSVFLGQLSGALRRLVEEGIASGELRPARPGDVVRTLIALLSFNFDLSLVFPRRAPGRAGLRRDLDLLFRGIAGAEPTGGAP